MSRYVANPIVVNAYRVSKVIAKDKAGNVPLQLENGNWVRATVEMTARMYPRVGDYWIVQEDGYEYLNPQDVFERKYRPEAA